MLSVDEVAAYLGKPKSTIYNCWKSWGLKGHRIGRSLMFRKRDVETWIDGQVII
ncbi:helix-turn-helix domain-containing protein [Nonomuraea jabiensis]|uniref:helix-turn-helix domain-containing protein n=1 Tax=Nonomuraea jabiensis TaxID=882448 RepID=UPI003D758504